MRVSSSMIFDVGTSGISRQTSSLLKVQQQLASGRRILTPGDDPIAAGRAIEITQAKAVNAQFIENQKAAANALGLEEVHLSHAQDLLTRASELANTAGSTVNSPIARAGIATELRTIYDQLMGIANIKNADGSHIFGGFKSDTVPFGGTIDSLNGGDVTYSGDDGQRLLQVSSNRYIEISDSGLDLFRRIATGNGYFVTDYAASNSGTGIIDGGSISNPVAWNSATAHNVDVRFTVTAGVTTYDLVDTGTGNSLLTGGVAPAPVASQRSYLSGQPIQLSAQGTEPAFDLGGTVRVSGAVADGDRFSLAPSSSQSVFASIAQLVGALESNDTTAAGNAKFLTDVGAARNNATQSLNNIVTARARVGSRLNELESLQVMGEQFGLQYDQALSDLQDLDYASAATELAKRQVSLEAAQQSFVRISQLSLFSLL